MKTVNERIAEHSTRNKTGCLVWERNINSSGYGMIGVGGKVLGVHVAIWEEINGPVPEGYEVDHKCFNRLCCEISHLQVLTRAENNYKRNGAPKNSSSGLRGVTKNGSGWRVQVAKDKVLYYGGTYRTIEEADEAAIELRKKLYGNL